MDIIVGTAGHIDHGKTALVKALTGTDTDRLPEEKKRGITIDLGFAELDTGDVHFGFVDVPGHERFVKNMLAGASGIDLLMLVIAADEGVMPQTREHFAICRLLGIRHGLIVITKADLVDDETLDIVNLEAAELVMGSFLERAPMIAVDSISGRGIDDLLTELQLTAGAGISRSARSDLRVALMPVDRSFAVKGFGTVVTGTLVSGTIAEGAELELLPSGRDVRVRGVQTHGRQVASAKAGQRTAVNLAGVDHHKVRRGMILAERSVLHAASSIDAEVDVLATAARPLRSRQRVRFHIGSAEVLARVTVLNQSGEISPGERGFAQIRFESPTVALHGDRFVLRSYSPQVTVGGGLILDPDAVRHRRKDFSDLSNVLFDLRCAIDDPNATLETLVNSCGDTGIRIRDLIAKTGWTASVMRNAVARSKTVTPAGDLIVSRRIVDSVQQLILAKIGEFHESERLTKGITREALHDQLGRSIPDEVTASALSELSADRKISINGDAISLADHTKQLSPEEEIAHNYIVSTYTLAALEPPKLDDVISETARLARLPIESLRRILKTLVDDGVIVKATDEFYFDSATLKDLAGKLRTSADASPDRFIDVGKFKELAGVSRKYAIPLLEYFDREKVTVRRGDQRYIV